MRYVNFGGRATRPEYWWWFLFGWLVSLAAQLLDSWLRPGGMGSQSYFGLFVAVITGIVSLALILPSWAVLVRRPHDTDRSGWWWLIALIPLLGWIVLIVFLASPGTPGPNRFGPPPSGALQVTGYGLPPAPR